jgi:hypothetical protein
MILHRGRPIDHVHLRAADRAAVERKYHPGYTPAS